MPKFNVLYVHTHDTGRCIQPMGHAVPTPALAQLAREGVLFRRAFCAGPTCSPSRAALLTGQWAHSSGMLGLAHRGFKLHDHTQHIAHILAAAGYVTALAGIQHVIHPAQPQLLGYQHWLTPRGADAPDVTAQAQAFLTQPHERPFFLDVGFFETHRNFPAAGPEDDPRYILLPAPLPDTPEVRQDMAQFHASARRLDVHLARILKTLEQSGQAERTLVICTTDHGIAFPRMKCSLTDHGIGVFLILRGPGGFTGGKVVDAMVSHVDVLPTLLELLDIPRPAWYVGHSMLPLLRGQTTQVREELFAEVTYHAAFEPQRAVRTDRWKYIRRYAPHDLPVRPNIDDSLSKHTWLQAGGHQQHQPREQLYDLLLDPQETPNIAAETARAATLADMRARLDRWMHATNDPLLTDPAPIPHPIIVNPMLDSSPKSPTITLQPGDSIV